MTKPIKQFIEFENGFMDIKTNATWTKEEVNKLPGKRQVSKDSQGKEVLTISITDL